MGGNVHEADVSPNTPLEDSSIRLATAIDEVNIGVLARNLAGRITYANAKILEWLGYERGELVGKPITSLVPKEFRDLLLEEMKAAEQLHVRGST